MYPLLCPQLTKTYKELFGLGLQELAHKVSLLVKSSSYAGTWHMRSSIDGHFVLTHRLAGTMLVTFRWLRRGWKVQQVLPHRLCAI